MRSIPVSFVIAICSLVAGACAEPPAGDSEEQAGAVSVAVDPGTQDLPPGHPPIEAQAPSGSVVPPPPGSGSGETGLVWQMPAGWVEVTPSSAMRRAQYQVPGSGGDAECVVYYFGPGQGGDAMANALRWADQFSQPDGSSSHEALLTEQIEIDGIPVLVSEVSGTYNGGLAMMGGPSEKLEDYMLLGAVAEGPDANWFFKLTGPEATVAANRDAFRGMIESLSDGS
jgi:hypothetical protein